MRMDKKLSLLPNIRSSDLEKENLIPSWMKPRSAGDSVFSSLSFRTPNDIEKRLACFVIVSNYSSKRMVKLGVDEQIVMHSKNEAHIGRSTQLKHKT